VLYITNHLLTGASHHLQFSFLMTEKLVVDVLVNFITQNQDHQISFSRVCRAEITTRLSIPMIGRDITPHFGAA
jgi:hypothetical protein